MLNPNAVSARFTGTECELTTQRLTDATHQPLSFSKRDRSSQGRSQVHLRGGDLYRTCATPLDITPLKIAKPGSRCNDPGVGRAGSGATDVNHLITQLQLARGHVAVEGVHRTPRDIELGLGRQIDLALSA